MARKFERDYRVSATTEILASENAFRKDVDLRIDTIEGKQGVIDQAAAEARDRVIRYAEDEIAPKAAALTALLAEFEANSDAIRDAAVAIVRAAVAARGDTLEKLLALVDAAAPKESPELTGAPTAPTAAGGTNTTQVATTAFVKAAIDALIAAAPGALDTLDELAAALGDDTNFASTVTTALANRLRFDAAQALSGGEKAQALSNLGLSTALKSDATAAISAGFTLTAYSDGSKSSGTFTPDAANHNYHYVINNGAHTIAAPTSDCAIDILYRNAASAGALTMSGFRVGAVSGDVYATAERASIAATFTNGSTSVGITAHAAVIGDMIWLTTTGALPTNFATGTNYYVASVVDANTVTLATSPGGAAISAGSTGSGTHTAKLASQFILMIRRINGLATYAWKALQ
jgi:hypothetical protein